MFELEVEKLTQIFSNGRQQNVVLSDVSFAVEKNHFVSIIGPSGCGKTTLLNVVAGFLKPTRGKVIVGEKEVSGPGPDRAFVFQSYVLFPWMSIRDNILYPMKLQKMHPVDANRQLKELLALAHLESTERLFPHQLSGGMKQRTGVIRALACHPRVLLMDEPLGAVDTQMRHKLQEDIGEIFRRDAVTALMVTHDVDEAIFLSDRVLVLSSKGQIMADLPVEMKYPRDRKAEQYRDCVTQLTELLENGSQPSA